MIKEHKNTLVSDIGKLQPYKIDIDQKTIDEWIAEEEHAERLQKRHVSYEA